MKLKNISRAEQLERLRRRYEGRGPGGKSRILDELCEQYGYHRKHAIRLLNGVAVLRKSPPGPPRHYEGILELVEQIWVAGEQPCGKRLVQMLPLWLPHYQRHCGKPLPCQRKLTQHVSAATLDRLLVSLRGQHLRGLSGTKPGSLLRRQIPIQGEVWDEKRVGFLEADSVAHCGSSLAGSFVWSLTYTDLACTWTSGRAVWNKGATGVLEQTRAVEQSLPFDHSLPLSKSGPNKVFLSIDNRLRPNPNAGMKSLSTALVLFLACLSLHAQERLPRPESLKYTFFLALELKEMLGTPIPTDPDLKRPVAFRLGDRGALLLPESKLTEQALKSSGEIVAIGQLWLVKIAPLVEGQVVASSKLKLVEVKAEAGEATAACFALAVSRNADKALELLVYGKEKEPLAKVPLKIVAGQTNPETPLDLSAERNDDRGQLTLTLLGKFQANLPVGPAEF